MVSAIARSTEWLQDSSSSSPPRWLAFLQINDRSSSADETHWLQFSVKQTKKQIEILNKNTMTNNVKCNQIYYSFTRKIRHSHICNTRSMQTDIVHNELSWVQLLKVFSVCQEQQCVISHVSFGTHTSRSTWNGNHCDVLYTLINRVAIYSSIHLVCLHNYPACYHNIVN